jgi:hypothetical protein
MTITPNLLIEQGTTRIIAVKQLRDARHQIVDPSGWGIHAVARADNVRGPVVGVWRDTPGTGEGLAEVVAADILIDPTADPTEKWVYLYITPAMSDAWQFVTAELHIEIQEPITGRQESFPACLSLIPTTVYT